MKNILIGIILIAFTNNSICSQNVNHYYQNSKLVRSNCLAVDGNELIVLGNMGKGLTRHFLGRITPGVSMNFTLLKQINLNFPTGYIPNPMSMIVDSEGDAVVVGYLYHEADNAYLSYAFKFDFTTESLEWYVVLEYLTKFTDIVEYSSEADYIVCGQLIDGGPTLEDASLFTLDRTTGAIGNVLNTSGNLPIIDASINNTDFFNAIIATSTNIYSGGGFSFLGLSGNYWPGMHKLDISSFNTSDFDYYVNNTSNPTPILGNLFITDLATNNTSIYATIAGSQFNEINNKEFIVGKFQLDGQATWIMRYDFQQTGALYSVKILENDTIIVTGALQSSALNKLTEVIVMKINGADGSVLWTRKVDNDILWTDNATGNFSYKTGSVAIIDNMIYVAGYEKTSITQNKASLLQLSTISGFTQEEECMYIFNPSNEDITFSESIELYEDEISCTISQPIYSISELDLNRNLLCDLHNKNTSISTSSPNIYFDNLQNNIIVEEEYLEDNFKFEVFNYQGQILFSGEIKATNTHIAQHANGVVFIRILGKEIEKTMWTVVTNY